MNKRRKTLNLLYEHNYSVSFSTIFTIIMQLNIFFKIITNNPLYFLWFYHKNVPKCFCSCKGNLRLEKWLSSSFGDLFIFLIWKTKEWKFLPAWEKCAGIRRKWNIKWIYVVTSVIVFYEVRQSDKMNDIVFKIFESSNNFSDSIYKSEFIKKASEHVNFIKRNYEWEVWFLFK